MEKREKIFAIIGLVFALVAVSFLSHQLYIIGNAYQDLKLRAMIEHTVLDTQRKIIEENKKVIKELKERLETKGTLGIITPKPRINVI